MGKYFLIMGGQLLFAAVPSFKKKLSWFLEYLKQQVSAVDSL
jgi:hypothetical protein